MKKKYLTIEEVTSTRNHKSIWGLMKNYINKQVKIGNTLTRKNLLNYIYPNCANIIGYSESSVDAYRWLLVKVKILKVTNKRGTFLKLRNVPNKLTLTKLRKVAADKSWREWFIPLDEKIN